MNSLGKVSKENDGYKVVFNRSLNHPIQKVWEAITQPAQLKYWFTDIEMDFKPGGKISIQFKDKGKTMSYGEIVSIEAPKRFVWTWEGELAIWELKKLSENSTQLTLSYSKLLAEYGINAPAGFHILLDRLETRLEGSNKTYAYGSEEKDPEQTKLQVHYATNVYEKHPELVKHKPICIEKTYEASVAEVWKAISDKNAMKQWYFELDAFKPELGFNFKFAGKGSKGEPYMHLCTITDIVPQQKLQYSWQYENYSGYSLLTFELFEAGNKTRVKLSHHGLETFPQDKEDFAAKSFNEGWNHIIGIGLPEYLAKK